jgi:hypothetical protein
LITTGWTGCSFTYGEGFDDSDRDQYVYDRLVARQMGWRHENFAKPGLSNYLIFLAAAQNLLSGRFNKIFVQWTALNRVRYFPGPDTYFCLNDARSTDFCYRDICVPARDKKKLRDLTLILNHDYHNILQLVDYCCILDTMSKQQQCDVYFINGLVPWTPDIETDTPNDFSTQLSPYTKSVLDFENRADTEIITFLNGLRDKFSLMPRHRWVNLFDSMRDRTVDTAPLGHHPGIRSHRQMADQIINFIMNRRGTTNA